MRVNLKNLPLKIYLFLWLRSFTRVELTVKIWNFQIRHYNRVAPFKNPRKYQLKIPFYEKCSFCTARETNSLVTDTLILLNHRILIRLFATVVLKSCQKWHCTHNHISTIELQALIHKRFFGFSVFSWINSTFCYPFFQTFLD